MNEKFKKDKVWGCLGKGKHRDNLDGLEHKVIDEIFVDKDFSSAVVDHKVRAQRFGSVCACERYALCLCDSGLFATIYLI